MLNIDEVLATGDPEAIQKMLDEIEANETEDELEQDESEAESEAEKPAKQAAKQEVEEPVASDQSEAEESLETNEKPSILTKDGKHTIPYDELEKARNEARLSKEEMRNAKSMIDDLMAKQEEMTRRIEWSDRQLKKAGIDATQPPENIQLTDEQLEEMEENYGELGTVIRSLYTQNQKLARTVQARQDSDQDSSAQADTSARNEVNAAIDRNADLRKWQAGDQERFSQAVTIDERLRRDPKWVNKTFDERFTEVVRLTKAAFGDTDSPARNQQQRKDVEKEAAKAISNATPSTPDSLSDFNSSNADSEKTLTQRLGEMTPDQAARAFSKMTQAQIDEVLEKSM